MCDKIHFFYINMDKNADRREDMEKKFKDLNISNYSRIVGVDGMTMHLNDTCKRILEPVQHLIGSKMECLHYSQEWIYDGTIEKSFPGVNLHSHFGTKGLTMSNLVAFEESLLVDKQWICILEDDAELDNNSLNCILNFINNEANQYIEMVLLDNRWGSFGGTAGMLYNKNSMRKFIVDLHPLSEFSMICEKKCESLMVDYFSRQTSNLKQWDMNFWDWKLWKYLKYANISYVQLPCIHSGKYPTTIIT